LSIKLPIGIENFSELRTGGYYYADKTRLIKQLLETSYKVNLITRPRRFGKTLAMSMLADFFDVRKNSAEVFDDLLISNEKELYHANRNQHPVLFVSFKDIDGMTFESACKHLEMLVLDLCVEHEYLLKSAQVSTIDQALFRKLAHQEAGIEELSNSLFLLTRMLNQYYGKPVILLIDEYDVPLAKANDNHYYPQMLSVIRAMFSKVLKTNPHLKFAVLTGCLRVSKESIFTGVNNFAVDTVLDNHYCESFGFEDAEVKDLLQHCHLEQYYSKMKEWYDGYHFGSIDVYCPWDVINYCNDLLTQDNAAPKDYWRNTSSNTIIRLLLKHSTQLIRNEMEDLLNGKGLEKRLVEGITYDMLNPENQDAFSIDTIWNVLLLTGYLTGQCTEKKDHVILSIPNRQIQELFEDIVAEWSRETVPKTQRDLLLEAFWDGDIAQIEILLNKMLLSTISVFDYKEDFYHGYLAGILKASGFVVKTNDEHGMGRSDIEVLDTENQRAFIIETKHSRESEYLIRDCDAALEQIDKQQYMTDLEAAKFKVRLYGIAFYKKSCKAKTR